MRTGYDSEGFPGVAAMQSVGMSFAARYAAWDHPRGIQAFEVAALEAAGMDIVCYYEEQQSSILQGYAFGVRAGQTALAVLAAVGQHTPVPINIACDTDIAPNQVGPVFDALDGLASVIGRQNTGIYGGVVPVHLARANGKATYAVQAGAWRYRAASVGVTDPYGWSPYAQVRQDGYNQYLGGMQIDHLTALAGDFGQWRRPGPVVVIPPDNTPQSPNQFADRPTLSQGMTNGNVPVVQFILNQAMGANLKIGDVYDHATYQAVYFWQGLAKLHQDGIVGSATWHTFGSWVARQHRFDWEPLLKFNDVGHPQAVKDLESALNSVAVPGFTPLAVDGSFGPKVRNCLVQYQRNRHLTPDGEVGKQTWADLGLLLTHRGK